MSVRVGRIRVEWGPSMSDAFFVSALPVDGEPDRTLTKEDHAIMRTARQAYQTACDQLRGQTMEELARVLNLPVARIEILWYQD